MHTQRFVVRSAGDLGRTVAQARHLSGVSQTDLAALTGIPRDYLSRLEGGMETLHLERILTALRALGVRLEASQTRSTLGPVSTIKLPDDVAAALAAAAAERGITEAELIAELVGSDRPKLDGLDGFLGCMDSGDPEWASTDTAVLRKAADARRSA